MKLRLLGALAIFACLTPALAQRPTTVQGAPVSGVVINRSTINSSAVITTGNTFQTVLAAQGTSTQRQSLTIQNNNTSTDNCWVFIGSGSATAARSIILQPGQAYTRYWPYVPSDAIQATCASNSDTLYVDNN
jgi:hypothetical protein